MQIEMALYAKYAKHKTRALVLFLAHDEQEEKQIFLTAVCAGKLAVKFSFKKTKIFFS